MDLTYSLASCMFLFLAVLCILNVLRRWNQNSGSNFPPGPRSLPLIGNLHMINLKRPHRSFIELSKQYGAIYSIQMGSVKIVVLSGYETVKSALVDYAEDFSERPHIPIFKDIFQGYGIPFSHGENWKEMRRFTLSTLRNFGMGKRTIEDKISLECNFLIKEFELQKGNPTDPTSTIHVAIGNIITSIVLGHRFDYQHPTLRRVLSLVNENIKLLGTASILIYNFFPILGFLPGNHKKVKQNIAELNSFLRKTFLEHHKELDRDDQRSFIDAFLVKQQEVTRQNEFREKKPICYMLYRHNNRQIFPLHVHILIGLLVMGNSCCCGSKLAKASQYPKVGPRFRGKFSDSEVC
ncbi:hypothetical protein FKM82_011334 [Ascaphus truei]